MVERHLVAGDAETALVQRWAIVMAETNKNEGTFIKKPLWLSGHSNLLVVWSWRQGDAAGVGAQLKGLHCQGQNCAKGIYLGTWTTAWKTFFSKQFTKYSRKSQNKKVVLWRLNIDILSKFSLHLTFWHLYYLRYSSSKFLSAALRIMYSDFSLSIVTVWDVWPSLLLWRHTEVRCEQIYRHDASLLTSYRFEALNSGCQPSLASDLWPESSVWTP